MNNDQSSKWMAALDAIERSTANDKLLAHHIEAERLSAAAAATGANFARVQNEPRSAATQVGGTHYTDLAIQPWAAMEAWMTPEQFRGFLIGNVIRYMARTKNDVKEDHRKAAHYLQKLIEVEAK